MSVRCKGTEAGGVEDEALRLRIRELVDDLVER
jgi:hypothetical protein